MIYTVTFNPAIDYVMHVENFETGAVNRSQNEEIYYGGKGINVSAVLKQLDIPSVALGFTAGYTGEAIERGVKAMGIESDFVRLKYGISRINVKLKSTYETEINGQGPDIDGASLELLYERLDKLKSGDILVLAGSIPSSLPSDIYEKILERLSDRGIKFVVDATKDLLVNVLKYKPFLVKPNNFELSEIFKMELNSVGEITVHAKKLQQMGARNVLVSMAGNGSVLVDESGKSHYMGTAKGKVVNSVGAGDSMVAGFIAGYVTKGDYAYAQKLGTACGGATAYSPGLAQKDLILELMEKL